MRSKRGRKGGRKGERRRERTNTAKYQLLNLRHIHSFNFSVMFEYLPNRKLGKMIPDVTSRLSRSGIKGGEFTRGIL